MVVTWFSLTVKCWCSQKETGCSMSRDINRGTMDKRETFLTNKYVGIESIKIITFDFQLTKIFESSLFSNRQHHCTTLPCKNGVTGNQMLLKLSKEIWQYLLKRQIAFTAEYLPITLNVEVSKQQGPIKIENLPKSISTSLPGEGNAQNRFVCIKAVSPTTSVFCLETRPFRSGNKFGVINPFIHLPHFALFYKP